eukprot:jgi/Orpsp1_1/1182849/evm.model.c7180000082899.1
MTRYINIFKNFIIGLGYISIISKAVPINNNNYSPQTQQDCQTLIEIYKHFKLNLPPFASNNQNCCDYQARLAASNDRNYATTDWICDSTNTRINSIILKGRNINTDIPWDLFQKLDNLEVLHLYDNQLTGEIKGDLRETFPNLKQLRIQNNNLSGYLPTYLPPKVETILFNGNNQLNDSIPKEWQGTSSMKDCILPSNICNPRNSQMNNCYSNVNKSNVVTSCQNDAQEDRSAALQKLESNSNNNINNDMNSDNKMNNNNNDNINNINNNNNNNNLSNSNGSKIESRKHIKSHAVLIMTGSIMLLLIFILIIVTIVSHYSRKKTREKEKNIYKGTTLYDENFNSRTEASIFYSKNNLNENSNTLSFDDITGNNNNNNNSISLFNCMNRRNSHNSQTTVEHHLLSENQDDEEISFIENTNPNNMVEMSFSVIDPSQEIIEPAPVLLQSPNTSYI